jgi:hypothetical protein
MYVKPGQGQIPFSFTMDVNAPQLYVKLGSQLDVKI